MAIYVARSSGPIADFDPKTNYVWCQSINRKIVGVSVTEKPEIVADLSCMATGNTCVIENPLESTVLAVGCVDRNLVTLNLASMTFNDVNCVRFMNKVCSKVSALDWHPERENYIAFGTAEGRIGLLDTNSPNNVPVLLNSFLSTDVYTLKWCEMTDEFFQKSTVLFATGKSKLAYYKMIGASKHGRYHITVTLSSLTTPYHFQIPLSCASSEWFPACRPRDIIYSSEHRTDLCLSMTSARVWLNFITVKFPDGTYAPCSSRTMCWQWLRMSATYD